MTYEHPIFESKETDNVALEATNVTYEFKPEYILRDTYFKYIESFIPKTDHILMRYIAKYEDKYSTILSSPYPYDKLPFIENGDDGNIIWKCTRIDPDELKADMKKVPLPKGVTEKAAFKPLQVAMLLIIRYYYITKQTDKLNAMCRYYGYTIYWHRFNKQWRKGIDKEVMVYTINNITYRSIIKKEGSVKGFISYIAKGRFDYYINELIQCTDEDIRIITNAVHSDMGNKIVKLSQDYYDNYKKGNRIYLSETMIDDEGTQRVDKSITASVEMLAQKYTTDFFMSHINVQRVKKSAEYAKEVSAKELKSTLDYIINSVEPKDLYDFYSALFYLYLDQDDPDATVDSIKSLNFLASTMELIRKGNSIDKNISKIRELTDKWLMHGSNTFRVTSREGTKTNYRKAVYYYFIFCVTNNV